MKIQNKSKQKTGWKTACSLGLVLSSGAAHAALVDGTLVDQAANVDAPGGVILRSYQDQIGPGQGDTETYGSSNYIIARDPLRSVRRGRQLFQRKFSEQEGLGPRVNFGSSGDITHSRALGAGSADSCASCHGNPKGSAGFGGNVATFPDGRDAPHLFGLGIVEQLADEITWALRESRDTALAQAASRNQSVEQTLQAKGIDYGHITAHPDGTLDTSGLEGIDDDLRVKPFFAQGKTASMREFIVGALKDEMGMEAWDPVLCSATDPESPQLAYSSSGFLYDPTQDTFERPPVCDQFEDNDGDGITAEIDPAIVDHFEFYLLNYFKPATGKRSRIEKQGLNHLRDIGCTSCHIPDLTINSDRRIADVETVYDKEKGGVFNQLYATATGRFVIEDDGEDYPLLNPAYESFVAKDIFTDLKRHDLGPQFHERDYDGRVQTHFITEPLWGVGTTAPYGHDGRSIDLDQVIRRHGGEALESRNAYVNKLDDRQRLALREYLRSLVLFPPDDTASNLNAGNPDSDDPQNPTEHGSIRLPALFQIPELGSE
ncbi:MAG: di-heme oxidoredictase family protein [Granulosicoccaceae bacterium]